MTTAQNPSAFIIRPAAEGDCHTLLHLIRQLSIYEKMEDQLTATAEDLRHTLFGLKQAEALIAEEDGQPVGFALFFHNYSTFLGRAGLYLEDLYVEEHYRGKGYGKALLAHLAQIALQRGCPRFEWSCLNWNTPSIHFYESLGAHTMEGWSTFRLSGSALKDLGTLS